jgi:CRP-like cAMP-binding protein
VRAHDRDPSVLRRMLALRQFPMLDAAAVDELAAVAENLVGARFAAGSVIAEASSRPAAIHLIVDGRIESRPRGHTWGPRNVFGALEVAAGRDLAMTAVAATDVETLQLSAGDFNEVLEDNFSVLLSTVRDLAARMMVVPPPACTDLSLEFGAGKLGLVPRLILLRQQLPLQRAGLHALAALAHRCDEVRWPAVTVIAGAGEVATHAHVIVEGELDVLCDGRVLHTLGAGASLGFLETLAGKPHAFSIVSRSPGRALRSAATAIVDMLEDHTDVAFGMIASLSAALLDAVEN